MTPLFVALAASCGCDFPAVSNQNKCNHTAKWLVGFTLADALITLTALTVVILNRLHILNIPPATSNRLLGLSTITTLLWILFGCVTGKEGYTMVKSSLSAAVSHSTKEKLPSSHTNGEQDEEPERKNLGTKADFEATF